MLQCVTNSFQTQSRLYQMGKAQLTDCPFCGNTPENLWHWQQVCPQFNNAHTKVHDDIWTEVLAAILKHLPEGYDVYKVVRPD